MTDRELQRRFQTQLQRPASRVQCVAPEQLLAAAEPEAPDALRLQVLEHVATCPACREEYEVARALLRAAAPPAAARAWRPLALAASVVLAAGIAVLWQLQQPRTPTLRGGEGVPTLYAAALTADSVQFAWQPTGPDDRYTLEVLAESGDLVFSTTTADTVLRVPQTALGSGRRAWGIASVAPNGTERRSKVDSLQLP